MVAGRGAPPELPLKAVGCYRRAGYVCFRWLACARDGSVPQSANQEVGKFLAANTPPTGWELRGEIPRRGSLFWEEHRSEIIALVMCTHFRAVRYTIRRHMRASSAAVGVRSSTAAGIGRVPRFGYAAGRGARRHRRCARDHRNPIAGHVASTRGRVSSRTAPSLKNPHRWPRVVRAQREWNFSAANLCYNSENFANVPRNASLGIAPLFAVSCVKSGSNRLSLVLHGFWDGRRGRRACVSYVLHNVRLALGRRVALGNETVPHARKER
jgi:hypothetical protein